MATETKPDYFAYETSLRDGAQTPGINLSVDNKLNIARKLDEAGFPFIEGGWPGANETDTKFFQEAKGLLVNGKLVAFGMTGRVDTAPENDPGLEALLRGDTQIITLFGKSWEEHVRLALRTIPQRYLRIIQRSIEFLREQGREVFYDAEHFFDGFKYDPKYALDTLVTARDAGASTIILCDTRGGSTPEFVYEATTAVRELLGKNYPLGIHVHNDGGLAVASSLAAVRAGATQVQGTINGSGERAGNLDLSVFLPTAEFKYGVTSGMDLTQLRGLSGFIELESGFMIPVNTPYVGEHAFTHKGGVHTSAQMRHPQAYEHISPEQVGGTRRYEHSDQGGGANVEEMARKHGFELDRSDPRFRVLVERMKGMRVLGDAQEFLLLHDVLTDETRPFEVLEGSRVTTTRGSNPDALVQVRINGSRLQEIAMGNGPINAFDTALRRAVGEFYPEIHQIRLIRYGIPSTQKIGTDAEVIISTEYGSNGDRWTSIARGTNQQEAGENALADSYNYYILRRIREPSQSINPNLIAKFLHL